jgi:catechol 2,3-dioxygenase-like lactoylglutathione lyase family enzyme
MSVTHLFAGIPVSDYDAAVAWYERLLGRPPDVLPKDGEAMWHVSAAGSIYVVADAARAGNALVTIAVDDLEDRVAGLAAIEPGPGGMPTAVVEDPDGNRLQVFADPSA